MFIVKDLCCVVRESDVRYISGYRNIDYIGLEKYLMTVDDSGFYSTIDFDHCCILLKVYLVIL